MGYVIERTKDFRDWMNSHPARIQVQLENRIARIENEEFFGVWKNLGDGLAELKFGNGTRIYFAIRRQGQKTVLLLLGGNKNGQSKDIAKARKLLG